MLIGRIEGATNDLGAPKDWVKERDGTCATLPVRVDVINGGMISMTSVWLPTLEEIERIVAGAPVYLRVVSSSHPPVMLDVGPAPAPM
jgi:hypothetical protein